MENKVSKKQLQEKFFGVKKTEIVNLQEDISDVFFLFEELKQHIDTQNPNICNLEENIITSKQMVETIEKNILPKENLTDKLRHFFYYAFIGGSLASVVLLYNPYVGIGAISTGFITGSLISYFKK